MRLGSGNDILTMRGSGGTPSSPYLLNNYAFDYWYSANRYSSDTTSSIRVQRDGDLAESDFTPEEVADGTLEAWVSAGGGSEDGFIADKYNQGTATSATASQATQANMARIVTAGVLEVDANGDPSPDYWYDGVNRSYYDITTPSATLSQPFTGFALTDRDIAAANLCVFTFPSQGNAGRFIVWAGTSTLRCHFGSNQQFIVTGGGINQVDMPYVMADGANSEGENDGNTPVATFNPGVGGMGTNIRIGSRTATLDSFDGHITAVGAINSDQSANRADIESYL